MVSEISKIRRDAVTGNNAKLERMTRHYGMADPKMYRVTPGERLKQEGPEDVSGFGSDYAAAKPRGDRPARKVVSANPVPTYATGGAVASRARGGRTKAKGTHVNVIIMPPSAGNGGPQAVPNPALGLGANPAIPPAMPPKPPAMPPGAPGGPPSPMAMAPGAMPPGAIPPRKRGGKVSHPDEKQDRALVHKMVKRDALTGKKHGGEVERARGGHVPHMTAGSLSGEGRLEKIGKKPKDAGKPQAV